MLPIKESFLIHVGLYDGNVSAVNTPNHNTRDTKDIHESVKKYPKEKLLALKTKQNIQTLIIFLLFIPSHKSHPVFSITGKFDVPQQDFWLIEGISDLSHTLVNRSLTDAQIKVFADPSLIAAPA